MPDGEIRSVDGVTRIAVEVELSDKGPTRTRDIVKDVAINWRTVVYAVPEGTQTEKTVQGAIDKVLQERRAAGDRPGQIYRLMLPDVLS